VVAAVLHDRRLHLLVGAALVSTIVYAPHLQPHEPSLTASVRAPSLGVGAVSTGRLGRTVDWVAYTGKIVFGEGCDAGEGVYRLALPLRALTVADDGAPVGRGYCVGGEYGATCHLSFRLDGVSSGYAIMDAFPAASASERTVSESVPWPWTEGAHLHFSLTYEAVRQ
jgi:hypothetical protein